MLNFDRVFFSYMCSTKIWNILWLALWKCQVLVLLMENCNCFNCNCFTCVFYLPWLARNFSCCLRSYIMGDSAFSLFFWPDNLFGSLTVRPSCFYYHGSWKMTNSFNYSRKLVHVECCEAWRSIYCNESILDIIEV